MECKGTGSLKTVASKLEKCKSVLMAVQEVSGTRAIVSQQAIIRFSMEMGMLIVT